MSENIEYFFSLLNSTDEVYDQNSSGRFVRAPRESLLSFEADSSESDYENAQYGKTRLPAPKLLKLIEKPSAHEQLIEWKKYRRSIGFYFDLIKGKLSSASKYKLLYLNGGTMIQKALEHFVLPTHGDENKVYEQMLDHLDKYFHTGVDPLAYLVQLLGMKQKDNEPFADFAQRLKSQADLCDLGSGRENILKTQIQKGSKNAKLFAGADAWVNKSLEDLIGLGIADEVHSTLSTSKGKLETLKESDDESIANINYAGERAQKRFPRNMRRQSYSKFAPNRGGNKPYRKPAQSYPYSSGQGVGGGAGSSSHLRCYSCHKMGHIARYCSQKNVFSVNSNGKVQNILE